MVLKIELYVELKLLALCSLWHQQQFIFPSFEATEACICGYNLRFYTALENKTYTDLLWGSACSGSPVNESRMLKKPRQTVNITGAVAESRATDAETKRAHPLWDTSGTPLFHRAFGSFHMLETVSISQRCYLRSNRIKSCHFLSNKEASAVLMNASVTLRRQPRAAVMRLLRCWGQICARCNEMLRELTLLIYMEQLNVLFPEQDDIFEHKKAKCIRTHKLPVVI